MTCQLDEVDTRIREDLLAATERISESDVGRLASSLAERRERAEGEPDPLDVGVSDGGVRTRGRGIRWLSAAAIVLVISATVGVVVYGNHRSSSGPGQQILTSPGTPSATDDLGRRAQETVAPDEWWDWGPGWHELDLGPVPRGGTYSTAWYRGRLIVAANDYSALGDRGWTTQMWSFDPQARSWANLPVLDLHRVDIVAAGDQLVAVGLQDGGEPNAMAPLGNHWATWTVGDDMWTDRGPLPSAPELAATGVVPVNPDGSPLLVWTGEALLDFTRWQVLDPSSGNVRPLAWPHDLIDVRTLVGRRPVWTGTQVVWPSRTAGDGLVWSSGGDRAESIVYKPRDRHAGSYATGATSPLTTDVFAADGRVIVVNSYSGREPHQNLGEVIAIDPDAETSSRLDGLSDLPVPGCLVGVTTDDERLLVIPCARDDRSADAMVLDGDRWVSVGSPPDATHVVNAMRRARLTAAGRSTVLFSALVPGDWVHTDRGGEEWLPTAAVWVPGR